MWAETCSFLCYGKAMLICSKASLVYWWALVKLTKPESGWAMFGRYGGTHWT